jgi:preprotein translocase subunit YajC
MDNVWVSALWAIAPTLLLGVFFYFLLRVILRADRKERKTYLEIEREERARVGLPPKS